MTNEKKRKKKKKRNDGPVIVPDEWHCVFGGLKGLILQENTSMLAQVTLRGRGKTKRQGQENEARCLIRDFFFFREMAWLFKLAKKDGRQQKAPI